MHSQERHIARILLRHRILSSDGTTYEELFTLIMGYAYPGFVQIKPQGRIGDRKNDGYDPTNGHYYQVYAPENPADDSARGKAATKAANDFAGLRKHWQKSEPIKAFSFVFNDKFKGSFPEIEAALAKIKAEHGLGKCACFLAKHLEDTLFSLRDDQIYVVVGNIPDPDTIQGLDYSLLNEVIAAVHAAQSTITAQSVLSAPEFNKKLVFNGLSEGPSSLLRVASYQSGAVENYFVLNSSFAKQDLRDELNSIYLESKDSLPENIGEGVPPGDYIFFDLLKQITPRNEKALQDAALVVMAYFFESCDVFDDPANGGAQDASSG